MWYVSILLFAWTAACWFSEPFGKPFLGIPVFSLDAAIPFCLTLVAFAFALILTLRRHGDSWRRSFGNWFATHRRTAFILLGILILHAALQAPAVIMFRGANDHDSAYNGLEGYHIAAGIERPMFCYGYHYVGTLIPHLTAIGNLVTGPQPFYLRVVNSLFYLGFLIVLFALVRRFSGGIPALWATALAAIPPYMIYHYLKFTEFPELLFWGALSLLLVAHMVEKGRYSAARLFWYGVVIGLGFYAIPQMISLIAAGLILLFLRDRLFFVRPSVLTLPAGFIIGSLPVFIDSWFYDWVIFREFFHSDVVSTGIADKLSTVGTVVATHAPKYLGGTPTGGFFTWPAIGVIGSLLFLAAFIVVLAHYRAIIFAILRWRPVNAMPLAFPGLVLIVLAVFAVSDRSQSHAPFHYLFPVWIAIPAILATAAHWCSGLWKRAGRLCLYAGLAVFSTSLAWEFADIAARESLMRNWEQFCHEQGIRNFYGPVFRTYWTAFITREQVIGSNEFHYNIVRYDRYRRLVNRDPSPAFLFGRADHTQEARLVRLLAGLGIRAEVRESSLGRVYLNFSEPVSASRLIGLPGGRFEARLDVGMNAPIPVPASTELFTGVRLTAVNSGDTEWKHDGGLGFVELIIRKPDGQEYWRQPVFADVPPGGTTHWDVLFPRSGASTTYSVVVGVNDFIITPGKQPLLLEIDSDRPETVPTADDDNPNAPLFAAGWGMRNKVKGKEMFWSGTDSPELLLPSSGVRPLDLELTLAPFRLQRLDSAPQMVRLVLNGVPLGEPIRLERTRRMMFSIPAERLNRGLNRLAFQMEMREAEYDADRERPYLYRRRGIGIGGVSIREKEVAGTVMGGMPLSLP